MIEARLAFVRKDLMKLFGHLHEDLLSWAPSPGMRTVSGQLIEIAGSELQTIAMMREGRWVSDDEVKRLIGDTSDRSNLLVFLESVRNDTLAYLAGLSDEALVSEVELKGWHESIGLPSVPRGEALRGIAQHEYYHLGQLVSYLWARGNDPYSWS